MHKKYKMQKIMIAGIAFLLSVIIMGMLFGRLDKQTIVVVKEQIDITKRLDQQLYAFETKEISAEDFKRMGQIATDFTQLNGKKTKIQLQVGDPVLLSALTSEEVGGQFAQEMTKDHTVYRIIGGAANLPVGLTAGDKIDIALFVESPNGEESETEKMTQEELDRLESWQKIYPRFVVGMVMRDVEIYAVEGADVHLKVTQKQHLELTMAAKIGEFILQLPGEKTVELCTVAETRKEKELRAELTAAAENIEKDPIENIMEQNGFTEEKIELSLQDEFDLEKDDKELIEERRVELRKEQQEEFVQKMLGDLECYTAEDKANTNVTEHQILEKLLLNDFQESGKVDSGEKDEDEASLNLDDFFEQFDDEDDTEDEKTNEKEKKEDATPLEDIADVEEE